MMKKAVLLINLGTPDNFDKTSVRRYLREFLADKRVIDLPAPLRYALLYGLILPFKPKQSAHAYQSIWYEGGSPLLVHSIRLQEKLQEKLGENYKVILGMRYGRPSIQEALEEVKTYEHLSVLPLFPQYSSAATGSAIEKVLELLLPKKTLPHLRIIRDFYQQPAFIKAQAALIRPYLADHDYLLFSYHGIPERHLIHNGCSSICAGSCPEINPANQTCYRAQCYMTTKALAQQLNLNEADYAVAFQSRLGKAAWLQPYTDVFLPQLIQKGIKRVAVTCPSFVTDCLETLEEIGIRAKEQWQRLGGSELTLIPSLNENELWVSGLAEILSGQQA
ncbi:ferrochelatase [Legionella jordanis]|uniref:Ferrochelatase n=2 Tax=Legionella jordanis TaxID=456 RepID=A0A0W0VDY2_9GAMM|nr:ferrochelatase [Legionella jordanis]VEH13314.1 ferrochelatase [Legionella jordanis]